LLEVYEQANLGCGDVFDAGDERCGWFHVCLDQYVLVDELKLLDAPW